MGTYAKYTERWCSGVKGIFDQKKKPHYAKKIASIMPKFVKSLFQNFCEVKRPPSVVKALL